MTERAAYRVKEFAEAIGVDRVTVWRWIKAGKLETIKVAGMTLIPAHILAHIPSGHSTPLDVAKRIMSKRANALRALADVPE